jgi:hypothetical protein
MSNKNNRIKNKRRQLFEQCPYCFWCDEPVILPDSYPRGEIPHNAATLDHIRGKRSRGRQLKIAHGQQYPELIVLACNRCNNLRNESEKEFFRQIEIARRKEIHDAMSQHSSH